MSLAQTIEQRLSQFNPRSLELVDESAHHIGHEGASGGGGHYSLTIVSERFAGMTQVERHRQVYRALGALMHKEIHALAIRALTPDEL